MVWITKTIFVGSDGNKTIEINESTTKEWANKKRMQQIERWFEILVDKSNSCKIPSSIYSATTLTVELFVEYQKELIEFTLNFKNKHLKPQTQNSFSIEVYEECV